MNKSKLNSLTQISAIAGGRYNHIMMGDTRNKLLRLLLNKVTNSDFNGASKDIERIVLIDTKKDGYDEIQSLINDIKENNSNAQNALIILNEITDYDHTKTIKKSLKSFKFPKKENVSIPHSIKVLFDADCINEDDIRKYEQKIKESSNLTDEFFIKAIHSNSKFANYGIQPVQPIHPIQPMLPVQPIQPIQPMQPAQTMQPIFPNQQIPLQPQFANSPNPYKDLPPTASCQVIYPPAPPTQFSPSHLPPSRTYSLPQYYPNSSYQPPYPPPGGSYY